MVMEVNSIDFWCRLTLYKKYNILELIFAKFNLLLYFKFVLYLKIIYNLEFIYLKEIKMLCLLF